jgi:hypothetical protein
MTDTNTTEDLFDDAQEEFPGKEDLKDRLVAIWVTGKHGVRKSDAVGSRPYDWYETITLVLDDGPNWNGTKVVDDETKPMLVPSVAAEGPQRLDGFQHTTSGLTARLASRVALSPAAPAVNGAGTVDKPKTFKPMLGRINSKKNRVQGRSPSWSIGEPVEADRVIARSHADLIRQISKELETAGLKAPDGTDEFDE